MPAGSRFELFVALRYLMAKRQQRVIGFITVIAVLGVASGVMALVIGLAVNNGFRNTLERSLLGATPHVILLEKEPAEGIRNWRDLAPKLAALPGVTSVTPSVYGEVFLSGPQRSSGAILKGVPEQAVPGGFDRARGRGYPGIVLGSRLASSTGMMLDSLVTLISPQGEMTPLGARPARFRFRVVGIFNSGFYDFDSGYAFAPLEQVQRVLGAPDTVTALELKLAEVDHAPAAARAAEGVAGPALAASHWMEQNRQLLSALRLEKTVSLITIGLIQLVAALNILSVLSMNVMEKRRGVAILLSLGARRGQIGRIFVLQGLIIAAAGIVLGLASGYGLSYAAAAGRWIPLDEAIYSMSHVPFEPRPADGIWISAGALLTALLASLIPARNAARTAPLEILRYE